MKLLIVNPNISESVSALIEAEARRVASPDTVLTVLTAPFGVAYIETRFEAMIGAYAVAQLAGEHIAGHDALIVAAFGDPGVSALREVLDVPVVGMTEAALASATLLGRRFSIVAISRRIGLWYRETIEHAGLAARLASVRTLDEPLADVATVQSDQAARLHELCLSAVNDDAADVIILGGAPLAGLARSLGGAIPVPLVDGVSSAVKHAESLARLAPGRARAGSFAPPPEKPNRGLPQAIAALLARR